MAEPNMSTRPTGPGWNWDPYRNIWTRRSPEEIEREFGPKQATETAPAQPAAQSVSTIGMTVAQADAQNAAVNPYSGQGPGIQPVVGPLYPGDVPIYTSPPGEGTSVSDPGGQGVGGSSGDPDGMTGVANGGGAGQPPVADPEVTAPKGPTAEERAAAERTEAEAQRKREKDEADARVRRDAYARLRGVLGEYGLESLGDLVQQWLVEGLSEAEIVQRMRETDQFKTRFPAIQRRTKKGLAPISPGEYVAYERSARQLMRAAGIPEGFYDGTDDFTRFLENDLSLSELGDRVTLAANAAFRMPREARDALTRWGMGPGDITAFWLDPDKAQPLLERKYAAAQLAGASTRTGFGALDEERATGLQQLGVTEDQAQQGFGNLVQSRELFGALDSGEDTIDENEQIGAVFGGNAMAQRRIENRRRRRQAQFEGGGAFAAGQMGVSGLGDTDG